MFRIVLLSFIYFFFPAKAEAIVFLPAVILIPIAKIVAVFLLGVTFPAVSIGALLSKISGTPLKKILGMTAVILVVCTVVIVIFLKLHNPQRPFF